MIPNTTVTQAISQVYLRSTGKATAPDITAAKGLRILGLLNFFSQDWSSDPNVQWNSLRQIFTVTTVTATDTFSLSALTTLGRLSKQEGDFVRITHTNGISESDYTIVPIERLYDSGTKLNSNGDSTCAIVGTNIIFDRVFKTTDAQFGGTITIPGYKVVPTLTTGTDIIQVDDPQWLVARCAAEYCRNDITRVQLYPSLKDEADEKYVQMVVANGSQQETIYNDTWQPLGQTWG